MRRLMCLLLAVAAVSLSSVPIGASARQASANQPKSTITGKDLGKPLGNDGISVIFWSPGVWTSFGTLAPNGDVYYTPQSVPLPPSAKNCGALYASMERFCPFPIAAHVVTCHPSPSSLEGPTNEAPPLAEGDAPATLATLGEDGTITIVVLMAVADEKGFPSALANGIPPPNGANCQGSRSDRKAKGSAQWGDNVLLANSGGNFTFTVDNQVNTSRSPTPATGGGNFVTKPIGIATIAGGTGLAIWAATSGGGSSNNTTGGTTPAAPDFQSTVIGLHALIYQVSTSSGTLCGGGQSSSGSVTMSGTASASTAVFTNLPDTGSTPVTVTGTTTQNSDGTFTFKGTVSGGTPTGGTFSFTITITFTPVTGSASKAAGSANGVAGCSSLTLTITIGSA